MDPSSNPARTTRFMAAGGTFDCKATFGHACAAFEPHAAGTVAYIDLEGVAQSQTFQPGIKPVRALSFQAGTAVNITIYDNGH